MPAGLTDEEVFSKPSGGLSDEEVFGKSAGLTDAEVFAPPPKSLTPETDKALVDTADQTVLSRARAFVEGAGIPTSVEGLRDFGKFLIRSPVQDVKDIYQGVTEIPGKIRNFGQTISESPAAKVYHDPLSKESFGTYGTVVGMTVGPKAIEAVKSIPGKFIAEKGMKVEPASSSDVETATSDHPEQQAQPQAEEQPLNQPIEGVSPDAQEPDTQTSQVQAGDTRQTSETSAVESSPQVEQPVQEGGEPLPAVETGASAKAFEEIYGQGEIPIGEGRSPEEMFAQAQERMATGRADPYGTVARARTGAITPDEFADLVVEHDRLVNEAAAREGTPEYESAYQHASDFARNVLKPAETKVSDTMRAMQIKAPIDYTRLTGFRRALNERMSRDMTPQEAPAFERAANDVAKARQEAQRSGVDTAARVQRRFARVKDVTFEDAVKELHDSIAELVADCNL